MRAAPAIATLALLAGCARAIRVEPGVAGSGRGGAGEPADTGVKVAFSLDGAGAGSRVSWSFGDGAPPGEGARVEHAFARAGRYEVQARQEGQVVATAGLDVRPRSVLRAIPAAAQGALYCPAPGEKLDDAADLLDGMLGPGGSSSLLERTGVVRLALQSAAAGEGAVDPDEGLAFFTLAGMSGAVAAVGVTDGEAALQVLLQDLEEQGAQVSQSAAGYVRVRQSGRPDAAAFVDRGYLYLALPERAERLEVQLQQAVAEVSGADGRGVERWPLIGELAGQVPEGTCSLALPGRPGAALRGFFGTLRVERRDLLAEGVFRADGPLWKAPAAPPALIDRAPEGPVAALSVSAPPEALAALALGPPGSPERQRSVEELRREGWDVEGLLAAVGDELAVVAWFDAPAFLANLIRGNREPDPRGVLWIEARLRRQDLALNALREALESRQVEYERPESQGAAQALRFRAEGHAVEVTLEGGRAHLRAGQVARWRRMEPLREDLSARTGGAGAFGPGHVSALVDLNRLRQELRARASVPGVSDERVADVQRFAVKFIDQMTGIGELAVDVAPDPLGARLRARATVGPTRPR